MTCKKTKPDRSAKSARCESVETKMIGLIGAGNNPMDGRKIKKRKRIQMNLKKKYGNYELHPQMKITGYENEIWDEKKEIIEELKRAVQEKQKEKKTCILSFDLYPGVRKEDDDDKIRLNQQKPSKYKGLSRFGPEKNLQRINKFMKERPIFYKNLIQMKENIRFYLRCFYCITKVMILQFNSENRTELARNG